MAQKFSEYLKSIGVRKVEDSKKAASLRPILYVGLGGFGCSVLKKLKTEIHRVVPEHADGFAFLGMDTQRDSYDILNQNEYVPLSLGVNPTDAAKLQPAYLDWYMNVTGSWQARNIQAGADKVKAVGRLAFRNQATFQDFLSKVTAAQERLGRFRTNFIAGAPIKVYVISTMAGGTGAGCLLDVMFVLGKIFRDFAGADFPYQAILATPDVLQGEANEGDMLNFYSNTYATLKEIHHFVGTVDSEVLSYNDSLLDRIRVDRTLLPNPIHLIGDRNETGTSVVTMIQELQDLVVSYLLSEVQTPMEDDTGQPKVQDLENVHFDDLGFDDTQKAFSSYGVVRVGIPADVVEYLFALRLILATIDGELREPKNILETVSGWMDAQNLKESGTDQLQDRIKREIGGDSLQIAIDAVGSVLPSGYKREEVVRDCLSYRETMQKALGKDRKEAIDQKGSVVIDGAADVLRKECRAMLEKENLGAAQSFLKILETSLKGHQQALRDEISAARKLLSLREREIAESITGVEAAVAGSFYKRKERIADAVSDFDGRLSLRLEGEMDVWIKEKADAVYTRLLEVCGEVQKRWSPVLESLKGRHHQVVSLITQHEIVLDRMADVGTRGPGNRFSIVNAKMANLLYDELVKPEEVAAVKRIRTRWLETRALMDTRSGTDQWLDSLIPDIRESELLSKMQRIDFLSAIDRFYANDSAKMDLFKVLGGLSSPLFFLDPNRKEASYVSYWIVAANPDIRDEFNKRFEGLLPTQGKIFAFFDSPHEVILYQLKMGYTLHSFKLLSAYETRYHLFQRKYHEGMRGGRPVRPVHCWEGGADWEDLIPHRQAAEAGKWFILGRAFSYLFPTAGAPSPADKSNVSFLHAKGSNYYLEVSADQKPVSLGNGLELAVRNFSDRPDYQEIVRKRVEGKIAEVGAGQVRERIENEYLPILKQEIESSASDPERQDLLRQLQSGLKYFLQTKLRTSMV